MVVTIGFICNIYSGALLRFLISTLISYSHVFLIFRCNQRSQLVSSINLLSCTEFNTHATLCLIAWIWYSLWIRILKLFLIFFIIESIHQFHFKLHLRSLSLWGKSYFQKPNYLFHSICIFWFSPWISILQHIKQVHGSTSME